MFARFVLAWLVIIGVAAYDTYLTVKHGPVMKDMELNPLGSFVIGSEGGVALFVALKVAGTALALLVSFGLWQREPLRKKLLGCTSCVAVLAIGLVAFMQIDLVGMRNQRLVAEGTRAAMRPRRDTEAAEKREAVHTAHNATSTLDGAGGADTARQRLFNLPVSRLADPERETAVD